MGQTLARTVVLSSVLLGCSSEHDTRASRQLVNTASVPASSGVSTSSTAPKEALYFGAGGPWGWLVSLDFDLGQGARYQPLSVVRLCRVRGDSAGNVSWSSVPDAGVVEQFKGTLDPSGLRGLITWVEEASARVTSKVSVDLQPVSANDLSAPEVSGLYSNLHYIQRSGDLTGQEVLILGLGPRPKILITRYEGAPQGPFVVESLRVGGDTLSGIYRMARVQHFTFIRRGGELHTLDGGVLQRRAGLLDALRPKPQPPC